MERERESPKVAAEFERVQRLIAVRIRQLRLEKGLSQEELADKARCHRTYVGIIERREGNPSLIVLTRIAVALGVGIESLIRATQPEG